MLIIVLIDNCIQSEVDTNLIWLGCPVVK